MQPKSAQASRGRVVVELQDQAYFADVPGVVDVSGVTGCELVQLVAVRELGMAATCTGVEGEFSLASWYPDAQRLVGLLTETLRRGGAEVQFRQGGLLVTGSGSEGRVAGATLDEGDTSAGVEVIDGVGLVAVEDADRLHARARQLIAPATQGTRTFRAPFEDVEAAVRLGRLDIEVEPVSGGAIARGAAFDLDLVGDLLAGAAWTSHALQGLSDPDAAAEWIRQGYPLDVDTIGGRVVIRGDARDVVDAVGAVRALGLVRRPRAVDLAFVYGSRADLAAAGVSVSGAVGEPARLITDGRFGVSLDVLVEHLASATGVRIEERPSLSVMDGHPASVTVGSQVPVQVASDEDGASFEYRNTGTVVTVLTEPGLGHQVRLSVSIEVSSVDGEGVGGNPVVAGRTYTAEIVIEPGRPFVVASLQSAAVDAGRSRGVLGLSRREASAEGVLTVVAQVR